jgi:hypothetical protein
MTGTQFIGGTNGLLPQDRIRLNITGSRGGGPTQMAKGTYDFNGICIDEYGAPVPNAVPLDFGGMQGHAQAEPEFPQAAYDAAGSREERIAIMQAHQAALAAVPNVGGTVEDGIVAACLKHCYEQLGFVDHDDATKYVVTAGDVLVTKVAKNGGTEYTVRLAARFGV